MERRPASGEVRIDVAYCGICGTDVHVFEGAALPAVFRYRR